MAREEKSHEPERSFGRRAWDQVGTLVLAVLIALLIRSVVVEPFRIPSGSMLPTLLIGDHLFVNKFLYGAHVPFTEIRLPAVRDPERGDIVVFVVGREGDAIIPVDRRPDLPREDFVKRIVGLPGARVEVRNKVLYVNGERIEAEGTGEAFQDEYRRPLEVEREFLLGCEHEILEDPNSPIGNPVDRMLPYVVPPGRYFMMGDNRSHSRDSRSWGTVRREEMKGPAFLLYWSWNVKGNFLQFFNPLNWWSAEKRWGRIFQTVGCESATPAEAPGPADSGARRENETAFSSAVGYADGD